MKKIYAFIALVYLGIPSIAQHLCSWTASYNSTDIEVMNSAVILKTGEILFTATKGERGVSNAVPYNSLHTRFFKLDATQMQVITDREFVKVGNVYTQNISNVFEDGDSLILIGDGIHEGDSMPAIVFIKCDYSLNIGTVKAYPVYAYPRVKQYFSGTYAGGGVLFKTHQEGGYYGMSINFAYRFDAEFNEWVTDTPMTFTYFKLSNDGELLAQGSAKAQYHIKERKRLDVIYNPTLKQYYTGDITGESYLLDSNLNVIKTTPDLYDNMEAYHSSGEYGSSPIFRYKNRYVLTSSHEQIVALGNNSYFQRADVNFTQLDDEFNAISSKDVQLFTTDSLGGVLADFKAFDYIHEDSIFTCTYVPFVSGYPYRVALLDSNFDVRWSRLDSIPYLKDIQSIKVLPQGGFMIMGSAVENHNFDMYIATYDKAMIRTGVKYFDREMTLITIYPNPGQDEIHIAGEDYIFRLFDMQGKQLLQSTTSPVDVRDLSTGVYFYTITDKFLFSQKGKWIKE